MTASFEHLSHQTLRPQAGLRPISQALPASDIGKLSQALEQWINGAGWAFSCQEIELSAEEICAPDGLLPLVLLEARRCQAHATGSAPLRDITHVQSETGLCGVSVSALEGLSLGQWVLFGSFALENRVREYGKEGVVPLDEWYQNWTRALDREEVVIATAPLRPVQPTPASPGPASGPDGSARG